MSRQPSPAGQVDATPLRWATVDIDSVLRAADGPVVDGHCPALDQRILVKLQLEADLAIRPPFEITTADPGGIRQCRVVLDGSGSPEVRCIPGYPVDVIAGVATWEAARTGDADAQHELGWLYSFGKPRNLKDPRKRAIACHWFETAARQGHAVARHSLGVLLMRHPRTERDRALAVENLVIAAVNRVPDALAHLAELLETDGRIDATPRLVRLLRHLKVASN